MKIHFLLHTPTILSSAFFTIDHGTLIMTIINTVILLAISVGIVIGITALVKVYRKHMGIEGKKKK